MAKKGGDVIFRLLGDNNHLAKSLFRAKTDIKHTGALAARELGHIGGLGSRALGLIGGAMGGLSFGSAITEASRFQSALTEIRVLGVKDIDQVSQAVSRVSSKFGIDLQQATTVAKDAISTFGTEGQGLTDSLVFMEQISMASAAGYVNLADAANAVTGILKVFNMNTDETIGIMDKLKVATDLGITDMQRFAPEVSKLNLQFQAAGMGVDEMLTSLSAMTLVEQDVSRDSMMLTNLLKVLGGGNKEATKAAEGMKLEFTAAHLKAEGLAGVLNEVMQATNGNGDALRRLFPDMDAYNGYLTMAKVVNTDYVRILGEVQGAMGNTARAYDEVMAHDPTHAFKRLTESIQGLIATGVELSGLTNIMNMFADAISGEEVGKAVTESGWYKFWTGNGKESERYYKSVNASADAKNQEDMANYAATGQRKGLSSEKRAALTEQAKAGIANNSTTSTTPTTIINNNTTISHANFTAGDDMVQAHNRKIAMAPGV